MKLLTFRFFKLLFFLIVLSYAHAAFSKSCTKTFKTEIQWPDEKIGDCHISLWHDDKWAAVSITIDDNITSEHDFWVDQLEQKNWKATWFTITGNISDNCDIKHPISGCWEDFEKLVQSGHDVHSHTVNHVATNKANPKVFEYEYRASKEKIESSVLQKKGGMTLAYASGLGETKNPQKAEKAKKIAEEFYFAARGTVGGINPANAITFFNTKATGHGLGPKFIPAILAPSVDPEADANDPRKTYWLKSNAIRGWSIGIFHSLSDPDGTRPPYSNKSKKLLEELNYLKEMETKHNLWVAKFGDVAKYAQERDSADVQVVYITDNELHLKMTDDKNDEIFNFPLTIKIQLDESWDYFEASQNGVAVYSRLETVNEKSYAIIQAVPDKGELVIRRLFK